MKICATIIVFNSDFVLKQVIESIYPFMNQILISEGCVQYWKEKGFTTSTDKTNEILSKIKDPQKKIKIVHGTYAEKTEQANAVMHLVQPDTDYIWNVDGDEVFKPGDITKIIAHLKTGNYTSVGFKSITFYGGFTHFLTGFEQEQEFIRIQKYHAGAMWADHRPPTIAQPPGTVMRHLSFETLAAEGIFMYHYSYVFPRQVNEKVNYYTSHFPSENFIPDYFNQVYLAWVKGSTEDRFYVEREFKGVHEFLYGKVRRTECCTDIFRGEHPERIQKAMPKLLLEFSSQLRKFTPIDANHSKKLEMLSHVSLAPATFEKRFVRDLLGQTYSLSEKQIEWLNLIWWKYRKQLAKKYKNLTFLNPKKTHYVLFGFSIGDKK